MTFLLVKVSHSINNKKKLFIDLKLTNIGNSISKLCPLLEKK